MTLRELIFGKNPGVKETLSVLQLTEMDIERFRDCWISDEEDKIVIYTRTGGANREDYPNSALVNHPLYLYDEDDDFDQTYAYYYFAIPVMREVQNEN